MITFIIGMSIAVIFSLIIFIYDYIVFTWDYFKFIKQLIREYTFLYFIKSCVINYNVIKRQIIFTSYNNLYIFDGTVNKLSVFDLSALFIISNNDDEIINNHILLFDDFIMLVQFRIYKQYLNSDPNVINDVNFILVDFKHDIVSNVTINSANICNVSFVDFYQTFDNTSTIVLSVRKYGFHERINIDIVFNNIQRLSSLLCKNDISMFLFCMLDNYLNISNEKL